MCIEPPRPRFVPCSFAISSANIPSGARPFARQWPWPRWVDVMTSSARRGQHAPTAAASWPIDRCTKPGTSPSRYSAATRCSNPRITQHPPVHLERGRRSRTRTVYCTGRYKTGTGRKDRERRWPIRSRSPASFPRGADVTGKRVVITGAGRGLGRLLAHAFSDARRPVALVARTEKDLKTVADELPGPSLVLSGDVTDEDFNEAVADATVAEWGGVDVWICNAGISPIVAGPLKTDPSVWREVLEVNLTGAFLGARAAARVMREGGRLIFTGSVLGERPRAGLAAYSASKAGLVGLAKGLALDLAPAGITVNVVAPGWFDSPLAERVEEQPRARGQRARAHRASGAGARPPISPARTSSSRPTRRRSSPARCSTSTAATCWYERGRDASSRSRGRGERSVRRCRASSPGEPDTDLVLSDVSASSLDATVDGLAERRRRGRDGAGRRERHRAGRSRRRAGGRALRPARRAHQQRRGARAERSHPQPGDRGLGARVPGQRPRRRQRHPGRGAGHARAAVGVDRPDRLGRRPHRVVARGAVLRDEGGGDPAREGRGRRVRPRRDPGQLRVPGHVPVRRSTPTSRQEALDAIAARHPLGLGSADDLVGAYSYLASDASRWTTGSAIVVDGGYAAP